MNTSLPPLKFGPRLKIYVFEERYLDMLIRHRARIDNLPSDAEFVLVENAGVRVGLRYASAKFPLVAPGDAIPRVLAVIERIEYLTDRSVYIGCAVQPTAK